MFENTSDPMPKTLSPWWWPKHHLFRQARKIMENSMEDSWKKHGKSWENLMTSLFFRSFCVATTLFFRKLSAADIISTVRTLWRLLEVAPKKMYELLQKKIKISVKQTLIIIIKHKVCYSTGSPPQKKTSQNPPNSCDFRPKTPGMCFGSWLPMLGKCARSPNLQRWSFWREFGSMDIENMGTSKMKWLGFRGIYIIYYNII